MSRVSAMSCACLKRGWAACVVHFAVPLTAASIVVDRLSTPVWFALASPLLLVLGAYFASRLRVHLSIRQVAA